MRDVRQMAPTCAEIDIYFSYSFLKNLFYCLPQKRESKIYKNFESTVETL